MRNKIGERECVLTFFIVDNLEGRNLYENEVGRNLYEI